MYVQTIVISVSEVVTHEVAIADGQVEYTIDDKSCECPTRR